MTIGDEERILFTIEIHARRVSKIQENREGTSVD
jgi:hypothetical protein